MSDIVAEGKRRRSTNLCAQERSVLADLCSKHKNSIENKKTDSCTVRSKEEAWKSLAEEFRACCASAAVQRDWKQLKHAFENMKQRAKKNAATDKVEALKTGGGLGNSVTDEVDMKVIGILGNRAMPLANPFDSDAIYNSESVNFEDVLFVQNVQLEVEPVVTIQPVMEQDAFDISNQQEKPATTLTPATDQDFPNSVNSATTTGLLTSGKRRPWTSRRTPRARPTQPSSAASDAIEQYYTEKLCLCRQKHELYIEEHAKRMKVLDLQEQLFSKQLEKLEE